MSSFCCVASKRGDPVPTAQARLFHLANKYVFGNSVKKSEKGGGGQADIVYRPKCLAMYARTSVLFCAWASCNSV